MKDSIVKDIILTNICSANPMLTSSFKKNKKNPDKILRSIFRYYLITSNILNAVLFFFIFFPINFLMMPFMLDYILLFLMIFTIITNISIFYNIFFEGATNSYFLPLPIDEKTIYKANIISIFITTFNSFFPILAVFFHFYRHNSSMIKAILPSIFFASIFFILENLISITITTKIASFSKAKKIISIVNTINICLYVVFLSTLNLYNLKILNVKNAFLAQFILKPTSALFVFLIVTIICIILYKYILTIKSSGEKYVGNNVANFKVPKSVTNSLFTYNITLIKNQVIIQNSLITPLLIPIIILFSSGNILGETEITNPLSFAIIIGFAFSLYLNFMPTNLASLLVSLEGPDHLFIKTMPLDSSIYYKTKLKTVFICSHIFPILLTFIFLLYIKLPIQYVLLTIFITTLMCINLSKLWICMDVKHLKCDWQTESDLFNRFPRYFTILCFLFGLVISVISLVFLSLNIPVVAYIYIAIIVIVTIFSSIKFNKLTI